MGDAIAVTAYHERSAPGHGAVQVPPTMSGAFPRTAPDSSRHSPRTPRGTL